MVSVSIQKFFSFLRSNLLIVDFKACTVGSYSESPFLCQWVQAYSLLLFQIWASGLMLKPLVHWNQVSPRVEDKGQVSFCFMYLPSLTSTIYWRCCLFSKVCCWPFYQKSSGCRSIGLYVLLLSSVSLITVSVLYQCHVVYGDNVVAQLAIWVAAVARIVLASLDLLYVLVKFKSICSISVKNCIRILVEFAFNLQIGLVGWSFSQYPTSPRAGRPLPLPVCFSCLPQHADFPLSQSFVSLVRVIQRFVLFCLKPLLMLLFHLLSSVHMLFEYRKATVSMC